MPCTVSEQVRNLPLNIHLDDFGMSWKHARLKVPDDASCFQHRKRCFKASVEYFCYLDRNPVSKQDLPKIHRVERSYLVPQDAWKLLEVARDQQVGPAVWLAVLSGLRTSEIEALNWGSVDFSKRQILIKATRRYFQRFSNISSEFSASPNKRLDRSDRPFNVFLKDSNQWKDQSTAVMTLALRI